MNQFDMKNDADFKLPDMVAYFCYHLSDNYVEMLTCQIFTLTCQIFMLTCHLFIC